MLRTDVSVVLKKRTCSTKLGQSRYRHFLRFYKTVCSAISATVYEQRTYFAVTLKDVLYCQLRNQELF